MISFPLLILGVFLFYFLGDLGVIKVKLFILCFSYLLKYACIT